VDRREPPAKGQQQAAKDHDVLAEPLKLQAMALAGELGDRPKGFVLFDRQTDIVAQPLV
jgi:hypothetical protein